MNTEQMETVVDKLAEKIGLAVDKVGPLAQQTIDQYVKREMMLCCAYSVGIVVFTVVAAALIMLALKYAEGDCRVMAIFMTSILWIVLCALFGAEAVSAYGHTIAPLPSLLGL